MKAKGEGGIADEFGKCLAHGRHPKGSQAEKECPELRKERRKIKREKETQK